jgi:transposase-like protein
MFGWDRPPEAVPCPHCGAAETLVTVQVQGLARYACNGCRQAFAVKRGATSTPLAPPAASPS